MGRVGLLAAALAVLLFLHSLLSGALALGALADGIPEVPDDQSAGVVTQTFLQLLCALLALVWLNSATKQVIVAGAEGLSSGPVASALFACVVLGIERNRARLGTGAAISGYRQTSD